MSTTAIKKYHTIAETCERLSLSTAVVYALIEQGMLTRVYLPSPSKVKPGVEKRKGIPRITTESIERYERGDVQATPPAKAAPAPVRRIQPRSLSAKPIPVSHFP